MKRRDFIQKSAVASLGTFAFSPKSYSKIIGANDRVRVACVGFSDRHRSSHVPPFKILQKEMNTLAKDKEFEKAGLIRDKIYALNHINDISLMNREQSENDVRIEAYDIAHMSGQNMIGVMVVMVNGQFLKHEYK